MADKENLKAALGEALTGIFEHMLAPNHELMGRGCDTHTDLRLLKRDAFHLLACAPEDETVTLSLRDFQARDLSNSLEIFGLLHERVKAILPLLELCDSQLKTFTSSSAPEDLKDLHQKLLGGYEEIKSIYNQIFRTNDAVGDLEKLLDIPSMGRICTYLKNEVASLEDLDIEEKQDAKIPLLITETEMKALGDVAKLMLTCSEDPNSPAIATMRVKQVLATILYASEHAFLEGWHGEMKALIEPDLGIEVPLDTLEALTPLALKWVECNGPLMLHAEFPASDLNKIIEEGVAHRTKVSGGRADFTHKGGKFYLSVSTKDIDKFDISIRQYNGVDKEKLIEVSNYLKDALEASLGVSFPTSVSKYESKVEICKNFMPESGELMHVLDVLCALSKIERAKQEDHPELTNFSLSYEGVLATDPFVATCLKYENTTISHEWIFRYENSNGNLDETMHFLFEYIWTRFAHISHGHKFNATIEDGVLTARAEKDAWKAAADALR